ncbi:hypothetical protein BAE44_0001177, partial [Dichanthelium oligosanthes]
MALGAVFHGAQLALDLAVAGMSLAVAFAFFAVVTTVLCSAAFLHHSKPAAAEGGVSIDARAALEHMQMQRIVDCTHQ